MSALRVMNCAAFSPRDFMPGAATAIRGPRYEAGLRPRRKVRLSNVARVIGLGRRT